MAGPAYAQFAARPIPPSDAPAGWRRLTIRECGEPLIALADYAPNRVAVDSRYYAAGYAGALAECYARETVARRLVAAAALLPPGWRLVIFDAWRPLAVQQHIFDAYLSQLRGDQPAAAEPALREQAAHYVAPPSADLACPSPHATGCVIDLSALDGNGVPVDLGTEFDAFDPRAHTRHFETRIEAGEMLTAADNACARHRRILFHALRAVGFVNYPHEWWHYEWARERYGPLLGLQDWRASSGC
jgi:D-alanyl-D-alanine dipeptidase